MDNHSESSDEAPEEFSLQEASNETLEIEKNKKKELLLVKNKIKNTRRLNHERNKEQKQIKKEKLKEIESKKLPQEIIDAVVAEKSTTTREKAAVTNHIERVDKKRLEKQFTKVRKAKSKKFNNDRSNPILVQIAENQSNDLAERANDFRRKRLFKATDRCSGYKHRMMNEKIEKGNRNVHVI